MLLNAVAFGGQTYILTIVLCSEYNSDRVLMWSSETTNMVAAGLGFWIRKHTPKKWVRNNEKDIDDDVVGMDKIET